MIDDLSSKWLSFCAPESRPEFRPSPSDLDLASTQPPPATRLSERANRLRHMLERLDLRINPAADLRSNTKKRHDALVSRFLHFTPCASEILSAFVSALVRLRLFPDLPPSSSFTSAGVFLVDARTVLRLLLAPALAVGGDLFDSSDSARVLKFVASQGHSMPLAPLLDFVLGSGVFGSLEAPSIRGLAEICALGLARQATITTATVTATTTEGGLSVTDIASCLCKSRWFDSYERLQGERAVTLASDGEGHVDLVVLATSLLTPGVFLAEFTDRVAFLNSRQATSEQDLADKLQFRLALQSTRVEERSEADWQMAFDSFDRGLSGAVEAENFAKLNNKFGVLVFGKKEATKRLLTEEEIANLPRLIDSLANFKSIVSSHEHLLPFTAFLMVDTYFRFLVSGNLPATNGMFPRGVFEKAVRECSRFVSQAVLAAEDPVSTVFRSSLEQLDFICWAEVLAFEPSQRKTPLNDLLLTPSPMEAGAGAAKEADYESLRSRIFAKAPKVWELGDLGAGAKWEETLKRQVSKFFLFDSDDLFRVKYLEEIPEVDAKVKTAETSSMRKITRLSDSVVEVELINMK